MFTGGRIAPSVRSCEKIEKPGPDTVFAPRNRLKIRNCPARKRLSVPDFPIFSQLLQRGDAFAGKPVPALTLGAMWNTLLSENGDGLLAGMNALQALAVEQVIASVSNALTYSTRKVCFASLV